MRLARIASIALFVAASIGSAGAQSLSTLPRATPATGLNDSTLVMVADSARRTRAADLVQFRKALSISAFDSLFTSKLKLSGATVAGSATWSNLQTFAANQRVDSATGAARAPASALTGSTLASGVTGSSLTSFGSGARTDSATGAARASALVGSPAITVSSCTGCGGGVNVSDSIRALTFDSVRSTRARHDTIRSMAGASKRLVLQTTTSGSVATTALRFNELQQGIFGAGASGNPSIAINGDTTFGFWAAGTNTLRVQRGATAFADFNSSEGIISYGSGVWSNGAGTQGQPAFNFLNDADNGMWRKGTDTLAFSSGGGLSLGLRGGTTPTWYGGGTNLIIQAGITGSGTIDLQATNAGAVGSTLTLTNGGTTASWQANQSIIIGPKVNSNLTTTLQVRSGSATKNALVLGTDTSVTAIGQFLGPTGTATEALPPYSFTGDANTGIRRSGADTLAIVAGGADRLKIGALTTTAAGDLNLCLTSVNSLRFGATCGDTLIANISRIRGGNASMNILAGTGNSRSVTVQGTDGSGTAVNVAVFAYQDVNLSQNSNVVRFASGSAAAPSIKLGTTQTGLFQTTANTDTIGIATGGTKRLLVADLAATGAGDVSLCRTTTGVTDVITTGAACGTSSAKVKTDIGSIFNPIEKTMALRPVSYSYIPGIYGGRSEYGLIADSTMAVDSTLVFRAERDQCIGGFTYEPVVTGSKTLFLGATTAEANAARQTCAPDKLIRTGDAINVNDRAVSALSLAALQELIARVDRQGKTIDSLRVELAKVRKP